MKGVNNPLGAPNREGRDNDFALPVERLANEASRFRVRVGLRRVFAAAVGAFDLQVIDVLHGLRIAKNVVVAPADVSAEEVTKRPSFLTHVEHDLGGTQYMAGVAERDRYAIQHRKWPVV